MNALPVFEDLDLAPLERGRIHRFWIRMATDASASPISIPVMVARGRRPGPVVGVTAAVHGNELNGIPTIHRLFANLVADDLMGSVVAVPVVNMPGYLLHEREFNDGSDLNRLFPGVANGNTAQVYAHRFVERVVSKLEYLIDLHTASFGRVNSLYVRADMSSPVVAEMARLISPQIIVHNAGTDGTLRAAADDLGIPSITVEVGDPQRFQRGLIRSSRIGIQAVLAHLGMYDPDPSGLMREETIECARSFWMYTDSGGVLRVLVDVAQRVEKGQLVATISDLFGDLVREYYAADDGVVVGKSSNPVAQTGARILHLGIEA